MASLGMRFTTKKLQNDLVKYLNGSAARPFAARPGANGKVHAVYILSTKECLAYVRLTACFTPAGSTVTVDPWMLSGSEAGQREGVGLLERVSTIKHHILRSLLPHELAPTLRLSNPLGRVLYTIAQWLEAQISSVFRAA